MIAEYGLLAFPLLTFIARRVKCSTTVVLAVLFLCAMLPETFLAFFKKGFSHAGYWDYLGLFWIFSLAFSLFVVNKRSFSGTFIFTLAVCSVLTITFWPPLIIIFPVVWLYVGLIGGIIWLIERVISKKRNDKSD